MRPHISFDAGIEDGRLQPLWEDGERSLCREKREQRDVLVLRLIAEPPPPASVFRLAHEYGLKDHLESAWAARPPRAVWAATHVTGVRRRGCSRLTGCEARHEKIAPAIEEPLQVTGTEGQRHSSRKPPLWGLVLELTV